MSEKKYKKVDVLIEAINEMKVQSQFVIYNHLQDVAERLFEKGVEKGQQELIKKIEKLVNKRIKELNMTADPLLWDCASELKYFWKDVKKEVEK